MEKELVIYTDGAALGNPGKGGYGIVMMWGKARKEISQGYLHTTNNRMELLAVIVALETIKTPGIRVLIYSDSKYVCDAIDKRWVWGWQKKGWKDKKNVDLWQRFLPLYSRFRISMHWVKGHAGNKENERCDMLATTHAMNGPWLVDHGYVPDSGSDNLL